MRKITLLALLFISQLQAQIIGTPFDTSDNLINFFAANVAINGNEVLASGLNPQFPTGPGQLKSFLFTWNGSQMTETQTFYPDDLVDGDSFGHFFDIADEYLAISAPQQDGVGINTGAVYIYRKIAGVWSLSQKITANDAVAQDQFGMYVTIEGDFLFVSSYLTASGNNTTGAVYVYKRNATNWDFHQKLSIPSTSHLGLKTEARQGRLIAASDNTSGSRIFHSFALVGDTWTFEDSTEGFGNLSSYAADFSYDNGKIYVVHSSGSQGNGIVATLALDNGAWTNESSFDIDPSYGADYNFGHILVRDEKMFLGAFFYTLQIQRKWKAIVLANQDNAWNYQFALMGSGADGQDDHFGNAFAYDPDSGKLIVGAYQEGNVSPLPGGKAYWFDLQLSTPEQNENLVTIYPNPASGTLFVKSDFNTSVEKLELYSITGALIKTVDRSPDRMRIDEITSGVYLLKVIFSDGTISTHRILKQ
ncbi:T9SS type A sorting domain-containing protein [Flavobacterium sp.]|uniref:T9SS type A sorting domain-containing protein n=1 Tax=Flavobacterium sp. TaxID=239 RepID=UPI0025BE2145|nr:T9SS type A sorting domain-containing protein [Flavobacterium sp.]